MQTRASNGLKQFGPAHGTPRRRGENGKTVRQLDREEKERKKAEEEQKRCDLEAFEEEEAEHEASAGDTPVNGRKNLPRQSKGKAKTTALASTKRGSKSKGNTVVARKAADTAADDPMVVDTPVDHNAHAAPQRRGLRSQKGKDAGKHLGAPKSVGEDAMDIDDRSVPVVNVPNKKRPRVIQMIAVRYPLSKRKMRLNHYTGSGHRNSLTRSKTPSATDLPCRG